MTRHLLALASVALALAAGCGGGGGGGGNKGPAPSGVALFANAAYVDTVDEDLTDGFADAEEANLLAALQSFNVDVATFTSVDAAGFRAALAGRHTLIVPEQEIPDTGLFASVLDFGTIEVLRDFVNGGGVLVVSLGFYEGDSLSSAAGAVDLVDAVAGTAILATDCPQLAATFAIDAAAAGGTPFAGGPATLDGLSAPGCVLVSSLPANARAIYTGPDLSTVPVAAAAVVVIPKKAGRVVLLGWDYYDAMPLGSQDGGWIEVLRRTTLL